MAMSKPSFSKKVVGELKNETGKGAMNTFFTLGDINADGWTDIVVSGRNGQMAWFENKRGSGEWERHVVDEVENQECGGVVCDLNGDGLPDILNGGDYRSDTVSWWENPGARGGRWTRRVIVQTGHPQFHDLIIGDVTNDGRKSLVFWNQGAATLHWAPLPKDPMVSPWPDIRIIASGMREDGQPEEGLAIADVDGDGKNEIVAGTRWCRYTGEPGREWEVHKFAGGYITTVIAVGDLDGDGRNEVVLSEGDPCIYGKTQGGRLAWFKPKGDARGPWEEHVLEDFLMDAHSLALGDICGNGRLDILVGEIRGKTGENAHGPRLMVWENDGNARFTRHIIDEGTGCHHARLADFRKKGVLDIASRPLLGSERWNIIVWRNDRV
jgi:hypothetical protein